MQIELKDSAGPSKCDQALKFNISNMPVFYDRPYDLAQ